MLGGTRWPRGRPGPELVAFAVVVPDLPAVME
jgi:hypothetical protein